jgi:NitT/TauT family transport system permease protein
MKARMFAMPYPISTFAIILLAWEGIVDVLALPVFYIPAPTQIALALYRGFDVYMSHLWTTMYCTFVAFAIALVLGVAFGALVSESRFAERTLLPVMVALQSMPRIALAPLILVWFGFGPTSKIVLGALTAFFPLFLNMAHGLRTADPDQIALMRSIRGNRVQIFWMIKLPTALPFLFAGMQIGVILAMLAVIVGEFLGANRGMGFLINTESNQMDTAGVFAGIFILSAVGVLCHNGVQYLRDRLLFWSASHEITGSTL